MIKLYTIGCPRCLVLEKKLNDNNIDFLKITSIKTIQKKGYELFPVLEVDDKPMNFREALNWLNKIK